ncbi:MAG: CDP-alcohol phosphatidyltransferase family protein [Candidatus Neomarinimicrobiota bacterium]
MKKPSDGMLVKLYREYLTMLKPQPIESWPDLFFYRPIAYGLVKVVYPLPVTPNMISLTAMAVGLSGGYFLAQGTVQGFRIAGLLFTANVILDCSDGMLARFKKNGTQFGRIVDGLVDYCNGGAIFIGMTVGLSRSGLQFDFPIALLILLGLVSWISHSVAVDHARREFQHNALGQRQSLAEDRKRFQAYRNHLRLKRGRWLEKFLADVYLFYCGMQKPYEKTTRKYPAQRYYDLNKYAMRGWLLIDPSTHMTILILSALLYNPQIFFWYTIVLANLLLLAMYVVQYFVNLKVGAIDPL